MDRSFQGEVFSVIASLTGQANILTVPRIFIDLTGNLQNAVMLSQLVYWSDRTSNPQGWIYKSFDEWKEETSLTRHALRKARESLEEIGVVATMVKKSNGSPTVHYQLNREIMLSRLFEYIQARNAQKTAPDMVSSKTDFRKSANELSSHDVVSSKTDFRKSENGLPSRNMVSLNTDDGKCGNRTLESLNSTQSLTESTTEITALDISTRTQGEGNPPNHQHVTPIRPTVSVEYTEPKTALGQADSDNNALALVTQAQMEVTVTTDLTPESSVPDPSQPARTPEEKAFGKIAACYLDNKFKPSMNFFVQDSLTQLVQEYGDTWVMGALQEAMKYNGRSLRYAESVLDSWREEGAAPWEKPKASHGARQRNDTLAQGREGATVHVQPGKYEQFYAHYPHLRK
ncbi:MAG: DnaD domain protein [Bacilli bacterium]